MNLEGFSMNCEKCQGNVYRWAEATHSAVIVVRFFPEAYRQRICRRRHRMTLEFILFIVPFAECSLFILSLKH